MDSARDRLQNAPEAQIHVLDDAKARRLGGRTMLMPSPHQLTEAAHAIPFGETRTLREVRGDLARVTGADITCPYAAGVAWRLVAEAAEEDRASGNTGLAPWWRITRDGKPDRRMPGGESNHAALLAKERS